MHVGAGPEAHRAEGAVGDQCKHVEAGPEAHCARGDRVGTRTYTWEPVRRPIRSRRTVEARICALQPVQRPTGPVDTRTCTWEPVRRPTARGGR